MPSSIAYFKNGVLVSVFPRNSALSLYDDRDTAYNAENIVSDGCKYDLMDAISVSSIPCPQFGSNDGSVTLSMDYILRMCAGNIRNNGYNEQSILVLWKAVQLMPHSGIGWSEKDYLRLAAWLYEDGRIAEGDKVRQYILSNKNIQSGSIQSISIQNFRNSSQNGLVMFNSYSGFCCEICAKYSGRVYRLSRSWANRQFPELPNSLVECGCWHICCHTGVSSFSPKWNDTVYYRGKRVPLSEAQSRPYTDERTQEEKQRYAQALAKAKYEAGWLDRLREYHLLKLSLPEKMMPKSFSAYTKIKNANTDRYQAIIAKAKALDLL